MTKTKIAFAGVMGAILMSVGANAATITSVATKGYVDQEVGKVQTTVDNLGDTYVTMQQVADAIGADLANGKIDLSAYQLTADIVTTALADVAAGDQDKKYPSVGAVLDAIDTKISALGLSPEQIESLKELLGADGVAASISALQSDVSTLKTDVATLNGPSTDEKSVAGQIAKAIEGIDATYQEKSSAAYSFGNAAGGWDTLSAEQQAALNSKITAEKVTAYDATKTTVDDLTKTGGTIENLQTVVGDETAGLVADVAANTAAIANKITMPADCASGNKVCVLMVSDGTVSWTPVTSPVEDPVTGGATGE